MRAEDLRVDIMKIINVTEEDGYCELLDRVGSVWWCRITGEECDGRDGGYIPSSCRIIDIPILSLNNMANEEGEAIT